eukprot:Pgem_evm1s1277
MQMIISVVLAAVSASYISKDVNALPTVKTFNQNDGITVYNNVGINNYNDNVINSKSDLKLDRVSESNSLFVRKRRTFTTKHLKLNSINQLSTQLDYVFNLAEQKYQEWYENYRANVYPDAAIDLPEDYFAKQFHVMGSDEKLTKKILKDNVPIITLEEKKQFFKQQKRKISKEITQALKREIACKTTSILESITENREDAQRLGADGLANMYWIEGYILTFQDLYTNTNNPDNPSIIGSFRRQAMMEIETIKQQLIPVINVALQIEPEGVETINIDQLTGLLLSNFDADEPEIEDDLLLGDEPELED